MFKSDLLEVERVGGRSPTLQLLLDNFQLLLVSLKFIRHCEGKNKWMKHVKDITTKKTTEEYKGKSEEEEESS